MFTRFACVVYRKHCLAQALDKIISLFLLTFFCKHTQPNTIQFSHFFLSFFCVCVIVVNIFFVCFSDVFPFFFFSKHSVCYLHFSFVLNFFCFLSFPFVFVVQFSFCYFERWLELFLTQIESSGHSKR